MKTAKIVNGILKKLYSYECSETGYIKYLWLSKLEYDMIFKIVNLTEQ